jgi:hypothetical protein
VQEEKIEVVRSRLGEGRALPQDLLEEETKLSETRDKTVQQEKTQQDSNNKILFCLKV